MFNTDTLLDYFNSPEGIHKIVLGIILVGAVNAIFLTYNFRAIFGKAIKEKENYKNKQAKIEKLFPKKE